uniref:4'-phosphopantetheine phosphatase n=1 Tax=Syphacia muris TaxID=451379 RepID=A0A0N5A818_9BILA
MSVAGFTDNIDNRVTVENTLKGLKHAKQFAFDIGSSLVKIAYSSTVSRSKTTLDGHECESGERRTAAFAGAGIYEYGPVIADALHVDFKKVDDMECLVRGNNFLLNNICDEAFTYDHHNEVCKYSFETINAKPYLPYLLVHIGTGTSVYRVESDVKYERIGGSSIGGGAFFGLGNLLTDVYDFDELMRMAEEGDHRNMDVLIADIYEGRTHNLGLPDDIIAGSFGRCANSEFVRKVRQDPNYKINVLRSLLLMISNSLGQVAVLYSSLFPTNRIYFGGFFVRNHPIVMRTISFAVDYWSKGKMQAQFLRHEGYTAVIGAFLLGQEMHNEKCPHDADTSYKYSWKEHYAGSTELGRFVPTAPLSSGFNVGVLEMECCDIKLEAFPLLKNSVVYCPDSVSLNNDTEARKFWISCMADSIHKTVYKAIESQNCCNDASERAEIVKKKYLSHLKILREKPFAYGCCNVRNLLDLREQILNEYLFDDAYLNQKKRENDLALSELRYRLEAIDRINDPRERQLAVVKGLLAGNVFDWGAKEVVQQRKWLLDDVDDWLEVFENKKYCCVLIFADNSGADVILGVLPFAREFLKRGTKVIIACNRSPALNDITAPEMLDLLERISEVDEILCNAVKKKMLIVSDNGQGSPCLDLRRVNSSLCELAVNNGVDLVVIEGMGRAIHTNFDVEFTCDSLKVAVIKTKWLADRLGGQVFSVVCKFHKV